MAPTIILSRPEDWDNWIGVIRTKANAAAIWPYIDPATDENNRPVFQEPHFPTAADIKAERSLLTVTGSAPATSFTGPAAQPATIVNTSPLTLDEVEELRMRGRTYMQEMPKYNKRIAVMRNLPIMIQETVSRTYLFYTLKCNTVYKMLRALKKRVAPSDRARLIGLSNQYQKPGRDWKNPKLELASQQWEKTYKEDQKLGLPEVTNTASVYTATSLSYNDSLRDSFVLDTRASVHVCNDRSRFHNLQAAKPKDCLIAGASVIQIEAFGSVDVILDGPNGPRKVELQNTALVVSSPISIISLNRFAAKNVHWNTERKALIYQGEIFCRVKQRHDQWILEYNPLTTKSVSSAQLIPCPEEAAVIEPCSEAATEVELPRDSKTIECKATAEQSEGVSRITKSHGHAIQIDGHCPGDMPPKTIETAGLLTTNQTPINCRHREPCREIAQVSPSREMTKDIEIQICRQDRETFLEIDQTGISEKEAETAIERLAVDGATEQSERVMITKDIINDLQAVIRELLYLNRIRIVAIEFEKWSTEGHLVDVLRGFDLDSTRQRTDIFQRITFDPGG